MIAVIGGTGLSDPALLGSHEIKSILTPYADQEVQLYLVKRGSVPVIFLPRHGREHSCAPHSINYRANIWALREIGVTKILAVNAVGGINENMGPGQIALPKQIIDYSWGREHSFSQHGKVLHIDFTNPYSEPLRASLLAAASALGVSVWPHGVYACTQGPRLETAAEVQRIRRDGGDMIGMTGMPEAALARELDLDYASIAVSVNWAAGLGDEEITLESIVKVLNAAMEKVIGLIDAVVAEAA
ncbi:MAG: S-methyl-5'-thioinosine phosphorylase [Pseudohongiellaceae bacterium]|nr:S-methyl-5'-thioinosine phosphorylase [Pseudohongiellaceae bacterium]